MSPEPPRLPWDKLTYCPPLLGPPGDPAPSVPSPCKRSTEPPGAKAAATTGKRNGAKSLTKAVPEVGINYDSLKGSENSGSERQGNHPTRLSSSSEQPRDAASTEGKAARSHDTTCKRHRCRRPRRDGRRAEAMARSAAALRNGERGRAPRLGSKQILKMGNPALHPEPRRGLQRGAAPGWLHGGDRLLPKG